jgi:hypothetical protein
VVWVIVALVWAVCFFSSGGPFWGTFCYFLFLKAVMAAKTKFYFLGKLFVWAGWFIEDDLCLFWFWIFKQSTLVSESSLASLRPPFTSTTSLKVSLDLKPSLFSRGWSILLLPASLEKIDLYAEWLPADWLLTSADWISATSSNYVCSTKWSFLIKTFCLICSSLEPFAS